MHPCERGVVPSVKVRKSIYKVQAKHQRGASKTNHGFEAKNNRTPEMLGPWIVGATN